MRVYEMEHDSSGGSSENGEELARFAVLYAKASTRKHKKWEGDGLLICHARAAILMSEDGRNVISRSTSLKRIDELEDGQVILMGGLEVQIQEQVEAVVRRAAEQTTVSKAVPSLSSAVRPQPTKRVAPSFQPVAKKSLVHPAEPPCKKAAGGRGFVSPLVGFGGEEVKVPPFILNAVSVYSGASPVMADPLFSRHLRPHQKEGSSFIFERLLVEGGGALLADEMGLGKSIQTITATWALLHHKKLKSGMGLSKCLLVAPSSLMNNWKAEFKKWFLRGKNPAMVVTRSSDIDSYRSSFKYNPYLLISYDMALRYAEKLADVQFDIMVCDEAHRLKNSSGKLRQALSSLPISRRLLLTGTPLQNDLDEFHSLLDFVSPAHFGTPPEFRAACNDNKHETTLLIEETMLRRTSEVNNAHLPDKHEYIFFCRPSPIQRRLFLSISDHITGDPLVLIDFMRKLANHPAILYKKLADQAKQNDGTAYLNLLAAFPANYGNRPANLTDSGKLSVLLDMLASFRANGECCVVVSNYTKTLDMLSGLCASLGLSVFRLDGSIPVADRQSLVNSFNEQKDASNVFLLSTKAGGVGLNLVAASRLVLFDSDWNPANDLQAMARIWRDGQTRTCHIYRLATAGTIDEKILQRQVKKTGLGAVIDAGELSGIGNVKFRDEDLLDIFNHLDTESNTHDMLECDCEGGGLLPAEREEEEEEEVDGEKERESPEDNTEEREEGAEKPEDCQNDNASVSMAELFQWRHFGCANAAWPLLLEQAGLRQDSAKELAFAFHLSTKF